ncbi:MAG: hypothetical protein P4L46_16460 [Fimbriimonas sp.]|nr:hypothetical protein [Fimbriimonas sp.]
MALTCILFIASLGTQWFGPVTVERTLPTTGNPFDSTANDVRVLFSRSTRHYERLAYFGQGKWHATLSAPEGGTYQAQFLINGKLAPGEPITVALRPAEDSEFVRLNGKRFRLTSGKSYVPFGHNLAWQYGGAPSYATQLADMAKAGLNWTRIWANRWDGKSPFLPQDQTKKLETGWMNEPAFERWDSIVNECEKNHIKFQFVLFHHGLFSTTTDPNWGEHPWNVANGGFLADPTDFFVNPRARKLTRDWLRYAVARWGHSPAIMAWELFNEVQWVDAVKKHPERIADVIAWHREMGDFVRSLDPYHHLVTSSSSEELSPKVFESMDYLQPHSYPPNLYAAILGAPIPKDKPSFFGEFGVHFETVDETVAKRALLDGFWAALLSAQAGPAQYWYWDEAYKYHLYDEYVREAKVLDRSGFAENPDAQPVSIEVTGGVPGDLTVTPGIGWGTTAKFIYNLPIDGATGSLPDLSSYIQSVGSHNRGLMREPIRLRFTAAKEGVARVVVGEASKAGGTLQLSLNGKEVVTNSWPAGSADHVVDQEFLVPYSKGSNELTIDNSGTDWFKLKAVTIPSIGSGVLAACISSSNYSLMRLQWLGGIGTQPKTLMIPGIGNGDYEMRQFNLKTGIEKDSSVVVVNGHISSYVPHSTDEGVALFRRK